MQLPCIFQAVRYCRMLPVCRKRRCSSRRSRPRGGELVHIHDTTVGALGPVRCVISVDTIRQHGEARREKKIRRRQVAGGKRCVAGRGVEGSCGVEQATEASPRWAHVDYLGVQYVPVLAGGTCSSVFCRCGHDLMRSQRAASTARSGGLTAWRPQGLGRPAGPAGHDTARRC